MGTRADFYAGKGKAAEWLGSIAWDGNDVSDDIYNAKTEGDYRGAVAAFLASRDDATLPKDGWPWPWDDSRLTDCSYWFFDDRTWEELGKRWVPCLADMPEDEAEQEDFINKHEQIEFPDMSALKNVTFGKRSGIIILGG